MPLSDPTTAPVAYLVLRHLYDGDVIEWPIAEEHPHRAVFAELESEGFIARWDRLWPLHDRYRLTERGIAAIESVYQPQGASDLFERLRAEGLDPPARRAYLTKKGIDPETWPYLHDPWTHWETFFEERGPYFNYVWEDRLPAQRTRASVAKAAQKQAARHHGVTVVDLDDDDEDPADAGDLADVGAGGRDYDVS